MNKLIRIGVYRTLRRNGFRREEVEMDTPLIRHLFFDVSEWNCFLFMLEAKFNITFQPYHEKQMKSLENVIEMVELAEKGNYVEMSKELIFS